MHTQTGASAFLEALQDAGVSYIFGNFGSDHPPLLEALAETGAKGRTLPRVITCPSELAALSAAHGYAQASGKAQAVIVHVECGTQSLGGAVHNAARGRIPVLIFAGMSPFTQQGEMRGSRNEFIHWIQDVYDQRGIVRQYMKYEQEIRTARNIRQIVYRALQLAHSAPEGPVYLMAAREVLEEEVPRVTPNPADWSRIAPCALPDDAAPLLMAALARARRPLIVTSYLGKNPDAVGELVRLCERAAIGVLESVPAYVNFPANHPMYQGYQGNEQRQNPVLAEADLVLVIDSDVPWMETVNKPNADAGIWHIDVDPLKEDIPLWQIPARHVFRADAATALRQLNEAATPMDVNERRAHYAQLHEDRERELDRRAQPGESITPEYLTTRVREKAGHRAIFLNESVTSYKPVSEHLRATEPGTVFQSGGGSLGWNGGAAIGFKLARPDKLIVSLTGDGSYIFSTPAAVHWMARRYKTPFLQIIYNNCGWRAPKFSTLAVHPDGYASKAPDLNVAFDPPPDYSAIAAACGAFAAKACSPDELDQALDRALVAIREGDRSAVLDVSIGHL